MNLTERQHKILISILLDKECELKILSENELPGHFKTFSKQRAEIVELQLIINNSLNKLQEERAKC